MSETTFRFYVPNSTNSSFISRSGRLSEFRESDPPDLAESRSENGFRENEPEYRIIKVRRWNFISLNFFCPFQFHNVFLDWIDKAALLPRSPGFGNPRVNPCRRQIVPCTFWHVHGKKPKQESRSTRLSEIIFCHFAELPSSSRSISRSGRFFDLRKSYRPDLAKSQSENSFRKNEPECRIIEVWRWKIISLNTLRPFRCQIAYLDRI